MQVAAQDQGQAASVLPPITQTTGGPPSNRPFLSQGSQDGPSTDIVVTTSEQRSPALTFGNDLGSTAINERFAKTVQLPRPAPPSSPPHGSLTPPPAQQFLSGGRTPPVGRSRTAPADPDRPNGFTAFAAHDEEAELQDLKALLMTQSSRLQRRSSAGFAEDVEYEIRPSLRAEEADSLSAHPSASRDTRSQPATVLSRDEAKDGNYRLPSSQVPEGWDNAIRKGMRYVRPDDVDGDGGSVGRRADPQRVEKPSGAAAAEKEESNAEAAMLAALERESALRETRLERRSNDLRRSWGAGPPSTANRIIYPAPPPVTLVASDAEVQERALAAEDFARSQARQRKRSKQSASTAAGAAKASLNNGDPANPQKASPRKEELAADEEASTGFTTPSFMNAKGTADNVKDADAEAFASPYHSRGGAHYPGHGAPEPRELDEMSMASLAFGRMSMISSSVAKLTDSTLAVMEMLSNRPDVILPSPAETTMVRKGDVLSAKHILVRDLEEALHEREGATGMVAGAPYFRIVPKLNIAGVAQANASAVRTIVNELRRAHVEGPIIWVNLREEPIIYINDTSYIVRERTNPFKPIIIPNVTGLSIEAIERKLKQEVLQEAYENGGNISVHLESKGGGMEDQWTCAERHEVLTIAEVFHRLDKETDHQVMYFRRPVTQNIGPQPEDFDFVLDACLEEPKAVFIFSCQTGRGRTSSMMQIANIVRFYQLCVKDVTADVRVLRGKVNAPSYRTIQKLVSLFPDGKLHERRLVILMEVADKGYSIANHINDAFSRSDVPPDLAKMRLQMYAYFLVFSYYCEQRLWNYSTRLSFVQWLDENPELKLLIASVREKLDDQLKSERVVAPTASGPEAEAIRMIRQRHGNVLSSGRILCSLPMCDKSKARTGIVALRQLAPGVPILTCGRLDGSARDELIGDIRSTFPRVQSIHWVSLRAEPMVMINDVGYTLSDYDSTPDAAAHGTTMHASVQAMEQIEDRLRRDVLLEAQDNGGFIVLHRISPSGERETLRIKVVSVRTPRSTMEDFVERSGVRYSRIPMPFSGQLLASDVDPLFRYLTQAGITADDAIVINDSAGTSRTTVALNIFTLYAASQLGDLRATQTPEKLSELLSNDSSDVLVPHAQVAATADVPSQDVPEHHVELLLASTICQMLTAGSLLRTVDAAITLGGRGRHWNILHEVDYLKRRISVIGSNKMQCVVDALHGLRCYLLVLLACLYLDAQHEEGFTVESKRFSDWVVEHKEVSNIVENLEHRGEAALNYVAADNLMKADLTRRSGDVLTANFCLKADHFPGCQKKGLRPVLCGAPNFRKVDFVNVYGVAIPTRIGIHNVLSLLGASNEPLQTYPGQSNDSELCLGFAAPRLFDPTFKPEELQHPLRGSVVWVNLREEPILYVGDRPFVFRDLAAPYVNVELTGIQTEKIEIVEYELKRDVLKEASEYDGKFLVHDEGNPGELVGVWESATEETVKTLREVYEELLVKAFRCQMLRLPVTDEQSPDIRDFDLLVDALLPRIAKHLDRRETLSFVFNCQMGRGRTTTGMVICCLLIGLVIPEYYDELHSAYRDLLDAPYLSDFARGEYAAITQLKRVLTEGRTAKYQVDLVLEACSKMQNLRGAIESFAVALTSPDTTEVGRARAHHAGVHYLKRYFNLIVFAVYLQEEYDRMSKRMRRTFVEWFASHPEITALLNTCALK
ncbi:hypothetical protein ABB37_02031 [Leptomonas pyrrhocoris]|uniref:Paladin n=1 Tax=Leptomonas pyrrhocoris TaxID=157538 RepID=A0A0N0DYC1_LEPPY|nr:hypothetical protein ABB37_02031 [Leptomonas pyrrhocoris]XP_015662262.1 hypothetical protein ABB37_02031 [Leptomonas pyrrhocoris]KPA83822.1 hypothetical protein ABB37_02031 [Leptomonas pyrrhocoris]KPA83823.1 hypothetical protein ABB37_02031 [Leptomonas pyrrhocoris]|eukprot:XP_015662261.1 hypothetical protein ABB37_02031 [Leptomonas pyrrhocoris]